jgi:isopenicillin N synthase-like dioxygenase
MTGSLALPVIDVAPLTGGGTGTATGTVAEQIQAACRDRGFFYVTGHGVPADLLAELSAASAEFFALPVADKMEIAMARGGRAWRGYFPVGGELTSGQPDLKEGLYFGTELPDDDPRVVAGLPLHGRNLFPRQVPRLRELVLSYLDALAGLGQSVLAGVALSLGLDAGYFATGYTADPTILFRIFSYPASPPEAAGWGVGEHTDYGLLTLLAQDDSGGLQVAAPEGWIEAPPIPGTFVCNIGDMLDRLTGGWYRSTPHRVRNLSGHARLSFPFFLDPGFAAEVPPLPGRAATGDDGQRRWDGQDLRAFTGTYGDYLLGKVSKVFPQLRRGVLLSARRNRAVEQHREVRGAQRVRPAPQPGRNRVALRDVAHGAEARRPRQAGDVIRREARQPRLAALGGRLGDKAAVHGARVVAQLRGQHVVGDYLGARRERADGGQRRRDRVPGQVHGDAEPADHCGDGAVEARRGEEAGERVRRQVSRHERDPVRHRHPRGRERAALPVLGSRVIDLEHPDPAAACQAAAAVGERVQAGPEDHVLGDAPADGAGERVLGVPAAAGDLRPGAREHRVRPVARVVAEQLFGPLPQQRRRERVGEYHGLAVDNEVRGTRGRRHHRGQARLSILHGSQGYRRYRTL